MMPSPIGHFVSRFCARPDRYVLAGIAVFPVGGGRDRPDERSECVVTMQTRIDNELPTAHTSRVRWSQLAVVVPRSDLASVVQVLRRVLRDMRTNGLEIRMIAASLEGPCDPYQLDELFGEIATRERFGKSFTDGAVRVVDGEIWA